MTKITLMVGLHKETVIPEGKVETVSGYLDCNKSLVNKIYPDEFPVKPECPAFVTQMTFYNE